eukprot:scaffold129180_cov27-Tisochrysis_lutea.AAC.2
MKASQSSPRSSSEGSRSPRSPSDGSSSLRLPSDASVADRSGSCVASGCMARRRELVEGCHTIVR